MYRSRFLLPKLALRLAAYVDGLGSGKRYFLFWSAVGSATGERCQSRPKPFGSSAAWTPRHSRAVPARHLKSLQQIRQRLHSVSPLLRSTAPIGRTAVSNNRRQLRRRIRGGSLAPRPIGGGSLGGGRGAIATGWWSWHRRLISRDASRVRW